MLEPGSVINYSTGQIHVTNLHPVQGFKTDSRSPDNLARGIANQIVSILPGITIVLRNLLEHDEDNYALKITGTPQNSHVLGGTDIGYQITLSIYPRLEGRQKSARRRSRRSRSESGDCRP